MKTLTNISVFALLFFYTFSFAQDEIDLLENWGFKGSKYTYEKIHKVIAATNDYVVAVGETLGDSKQDSDGLFLVLHANNGQFKLRSKFGGKGNQAFHSVVQNHDGTFTLVGYDQSNPRGNAQGWVLKLDISGNNLYEANPQSSATADARLVDVAINPEGDVLAVGSQTSKQSSNVWIVNIGRDRINNSTTLSESKLARVSGITATPSGEFALLGSTDIQNPEYKEDIWVKKIDKNGQDRWGGIKYYGGRGFQEGMDITYTYQNGGFAIIGSTNAQTEGNLDMWLLKIDDNGELEWDKKYGKHNADIGRAITELSTGGLAIFGQTYSLLPKARTSTLQLIITDEYGNPQDDGVYPIIYEGEGGGNEIAFSVAELLSNDNVVIAGTIEPEKKNVLPDSYLGAITYKNLEPNSNTGGSGVDRFGSELSGTISFSDAILMDENGNSLLEANERGYFEMEVTNNKQKDLYNVSATIVGNSSQSEFGYWKKVKVGALKAGQKKKIYVPVYARQALPEGTYQLDINVDVNERYAASTTASLKSNTAARALLVAQRHEFVPGSAPKPGQPIQLYVNLVNNGELATEPMSATFDLPQGVKPRSSKTVQLPALRPKQTHRVSFSFVYDQSFRGNEILVLFQTQGQRGSSIFERYPLAIQPGAITQNNNSRNMGDMMVWMSHDPDEKGTRTFATNKRDVDIKLKILTTRQLEKNRISVYINGNRHQGQKMDEVKLTSEGSSVDRYNYQNKLRLKEGVNKVRVVYHDEDGGDFGSDELVFDYSPKDKPNLFVLSIGVKHQDLQYTVKDAKDFARMYGGFRDSKDRRVFRKVEVFEVTEDEMTTANNIKAAFIRLRRMNIKEGDLVVIFISSHGKVNNNGEFILIPSDYNSELEELYSVNFKEDILKKLRVLDGNKLVFIDACHSGSALSSGSRSMQDAAASQMLNGLIRASSGLEIIASCGDNEYSYEDKKWGNGAFTKSILEAFRNETVDVGNGKKIRADIFNENNGIKDNGKDGVITIEELKLFIQQRVPYLVKTTKVAPPTEQRPSNKSTDLLPKEMGIFVVPQN